jgi:hypothetical protein
MGKIISTYKVLVQKLMGKRHLGRCTCKWEDIIKKVLKEIVWEGVNLIHLAQDMDQ